jgi:hypothetical protein
VQLAVGGDEVVHGLDEHLLVGVVELLEELEAAQLELRVDEGVLVLVLGHGLGEELAHVRSMPSKTSWKCWVNLPTSSSRSVSSAWGMPLVTRTSTSLRMYSRTKSFSACRSPRRYSRTWSGRR